MLKRTDRGDLIKAHIYLKPPIITTMSNSWNRFSSASYPKLDDDRAWSSQEWRTETTTYDRSGRPDKTSWRMARKSSTWSRGNSSRRSCAIRKAREKHLVTDQGDLIISILKKRQDLKISSWETMEAE